MIAESPNLLTDAGKLHIMRFLAKQVNTIGGSIAVGTGARAAAVSDLRLTYEFDRATIYLSSLDSLTKRIVFKSTLGQDVVGSIYEVGLYSTPFGSYSAGSPSTILATFERGIEAWSTDSFASGNHRVGIEALRLSPVASATMSSVLPSVNLDLSSYANSDEITLAFFSNANAATLRVRFRGIDPAAYYDYSVTPTAGYNVVSFAKSALTKVGVVDWTSIDSLEVIGIASAAGAALIDLDGIRIEANTPDVDNVLVSRSVLATPIVKTGLAEMDIEYALEVLI